MSTGSRYLNLSGSIGSIVPFVKVSEEDYAELSQYRWHLFKVKKKRDGYRYYAARGDGRGKPTIKMHRQIMGAGSGECVDHIDGDGLNNTRDNLRLCTNQENSRNAQLSRRNTSGFKGVARFRNKWRAYLTVDAKQVHLGFYRSALEAALAYNRGALERFGEFARLNPV